MAATTTSRNARTKSPTQEAVESPKEITKDIVDYVMAYAKENPGYAALMCLGVGFILGWKMKPW
jgi:hypothetical protein